MLGPQARSDISPMVASKLSHWCATRKRLGGILVRGVTTASPLCAISSCIMSIGRMLSPRLLRRHRGAELAALHGTWHRAEPLAVGRRSGPFAGQRRADNAQWISDRRTRWSAVAILKFSPRQAAYIFSTYSTCQEPVWSKIFIQANFEKKPALWLPLPNSGPSAKPKTEFTPRKPRFEPSPHRLRWHTNGHQ